MWRIDVPSKVGIFRWRLLLDRLPTRDALASRACLSGPHETSCLLCFSQLESISRLFYRCNVAKLMWKETCGWMGVFLDIDLEGLEDFNIFAGLLKGKKFRHVNNLIWLAVVWCLWLERNSVLFKGTMFDMSSLINKIKCVSWGWFMCKPGRLLKLSVSDWWFNSISYLQSIWYFVLS